MNDQHRIRILAFDARRSRFGYALFEGQKRLLDWGAGTVQTDNQDQSAFLIARRRIGKLLDLCAPVAIAVRRVRVAKADGRTGASRIVKAIYREAASRQIPAILIGEREVRDAFDDLHLSTKHQIANFLAQIYPELRIRLPPKRRPWQSERRATVIFDAVATGVAYRHREGHGIVASQECERDAFPPAPHQLA
jgi:hypothetical protein